VDVRIKVLYCYLASRRSLIMLSLVAVLVIPERTAAAGSSASETLRTI
jgi:hypothetical protein